MGNEQNTHHNTINKNCKKNIQEIM